MDSFKYMLVTTADRIIMCIFMWLCDTVTVW